MQELQKIQIWSLDGEDSLGEDVATHSNILACRIPWTEEAGSLPFMELLRVRHNWATDAHTVSVAFWF